MRPYGPGGNGWSLTRALATEGGKESQVPINKFYENFYFKARSISWPQVGLRARWLADEWHTTTLHGLFRMGCASMKLQIRPKT